MRRECLRYRHGADAANVVASEVQVTECAATTVREQLFSDEYTAVDTEVRTAQVQRCDRVIKAEEREGLRVRSEQYVFDGDGISC